ncbi:MAG: hypothetical protein FWD53_11425 [Phycisphaerales bacterium]|nr:hypothetical protein [Phycisphaerales bacterium]
MHFVVDLLFLTFVGPVLVVGLYLLISGSRARRVGTEPHCRKCEYILLHLESSRCPECGTTISPRNTIIGEHQRRWRRAVVGGILIILGCLPMVGPVREVFAAIPWYHYKPAGWVFADLDSSIMFDEAIAELRRRDSLKKLPESVRQKLIENALLEQAATTAFPRQKLLEYLSDTFADGRLTSSQAELCLDQAVVVTLTARPIVAEGEKLPLRMGREHRLGRPTISISSPTLWYRYENAPYKIDGETQPYTGGDGQSGSISSGTSGGSSFFHKSAGPVGKHVIEIDTNWTFWYGPYGDEAASRKLGTHTHTAKAAYEVVSPDFAPKIELLHTPDLHARMLTYVQIESLTHRKSDGWLSVDVKLTRVPCDVAFDVFIKIDQEEIKAGSIACAKGRSTVFRTHGSCNKQLPAKVTVLLRPSIDAAKNTVDLTAIYSGEIEFPDVEVK